jgi:hypothetical protein
MHIIDRRREGGKSLANRQRFIRRARSLVRRAVREASAKRSIKDAGKGGDVTVPADGVYEPSLHRGSQGGKREYVLPGNKTYIDGDRIPRPDEGGGGGGPSGDGEGEAGFGAGGRERERLRGGRDAPAGGELEGERAGKPNARLNSQDATRRAGDLQARMAARMEELDRQHRITARPPVIRGGVVVVPVGLLRRLRGEPSQSPSMPVDTQVNAARARLAVMDAERALGYEPVDREFERLGYDIESTDPASGNVRFIEVKGRVTGADSVVVTRNEILYALNSPETFILAIVEIAPDGDTVRYVRKPFRSEPDFGATTVTYAMDELLARSTPPG